MFYTLGDSHSIHTFHCVHNLVSHHIGPILMNSVSKQRSVSGFIDTFVTKGITPSDIIILCFGEIDCRCHIHPAIESGEKEDDVINDLADNYINILRQLNPYIVWVLSITPPCHDPGQQVYPEGTPFLWKGTDEERSRYTKKMNERLKKNCLDFNIPYLDIYSDYVDEKGMLQPELSDTKNTWDPHIGVCEPAYQRLMELYQIFLNQHNT